MEFKRLFDFLDYQAEVYPLEKCFGYNKDGKWIFYSTHEMIATAKKTAAGLLKLGLKPGDKVALTSYKNRPEWIILDLACQYIGVVSVPLYPTISPGEYEYILNDAQTKIAVVGALDLYDKLESAQKSVDTLEKIFTFDKQTGRPFWEEIWSEEGLDEVEKLKDSIKTEEMFTLIYTSGTTGQPKGVMLTHSNVVFTVQQTDSILPDGKGLQTLSFLPLCHIFERAVSFAYMHLCYSVHLTGTDNLGGPNGDLRSVKPHLFSTVPRLLEKVYETIVNKGMNLSGPKRALFFWALKQTEDYTFGKPATGLAKIKLNIANKLVFSKWREALGGNIMGIITGAAPCPPKMIRVFSAAGIPIREGYGLTETAPTISINKMEETGAMIGTVGPIIEGIEVLIEEDGNYGEGAGEILTRGPHVMMGYYNKPEETAEVTKVIDGKEWFCTGDVGKFVKNAAGIDCLKITDRKKELLKTSGGKYVAPAPIEGRLRESFLIEQIMLIGEQRKFVSALIVPSKNALLGWAKEHGLGDKSYEALFSEKRVLNRFQRIIDKFNPEFSHIEQVKKFVLLNTNWEPTKSDGSQAELTPTMKLKRRVILNKFESEINRMYED